VSRVVLLDPAGELSTVELVLAEHPKLHVVRADALPSGSDVIAVMVPPEIPVGRAELERLPNLRIAATTSTGFDHLDLDAIAAAGA
jgi:D-3-phosphoglycerate dehydrogenase